MLDNGKLHISSEIQTSADVDPINRRSILPLVIVAAMNSETDKVRKGEVGIQWGRRRGAIGGVRLPIEWRSN